MKILKLHLILLFLSIATYSQQASAQSAPGFSVSGKVIDSISKKPVEWATIHIKNASSQVIKSGVSDNKGNFTLNQLPKGDFILQVINVGYVNKNIPLKLQNTVNIGTLSIFADSKLLKGVEINAAKPLVHQEIDRLVYDLKADPDSKGSSVLDMMRKVPFISLDADQNILLKNNASYKIFINGKPSGMMEHNAKEVLRSMPASTIEKIEVITNPPAKYDAEGFAGIINIVTNRKPADGYNGTLNINESLPTGGPGVGGSFNFKANKLVISTFTGGSLSKTPETQNSLLRNTFGSNVTSLNQSGNRRANGKTGYFGTELSYDISPLQLFSAQFNISGNDNKSFAEQQSLLTGTGGTLQGYHLQNDQKSWGNGWDISLNYQIAFKSKKIKLLTFSYSYLNYGNSGNNGLALSQRVNYTLPDFSQENTAGSGEHSVQADYVVGTKKAGLESGVKAIFRNNKSDFSYVGSSIAGNDFDLSQNVIAGYTSLTYTFKNWGVKAGVRGEETLVGNDVSQRYLNVVPSLAVSMQLSTINSLNFGFSQRLKRPGINKLNPYIDRSNPNYEVSGNPNLGASTINNIVFGYNHSGKVLSFNLGMGYSMFNSLDYKTYIYDPSTGTTKVNYANVGKGNALTTDLSVNLTATKNLGFNLNGNLTYMNLRATATIPETKGLYNNFTVSSTYRPIPTWRLGANVNVIGKGPSSKAFQSVSAGQVNTSLSSSHELVKNKLSLIATLSNPFHKFRTNEIQTTGLDFNETSYNQQYLRTYKVSLNYNFGRLKDAVKKTKIAIKNDDVSN